MAKITFVRLFLAMTVIHHWPLHQLHIKTALLHSELQEEVYMEQPPGFLAREVLVLFVSFNDLSMI